MTVSEKTVVFPSEQSLGSLYLIKGGSGNANWWDRPVGEARGYVNVPAYGELHLLVSPTADVNLLNALEPNTLVSIDFRQRHMTDLELASIQNLTGLRYLTLPESPLTDRGLMYLINLNNLHTVDLGFTNITDDGLEYLKSLAKLRRLYVDHTKISEQGAQSLREVLPKCNLVSRAKRTLRFPELEALGSLWVAGTTETGKRNWKEIGPARSLIEVARRDFVRLEVKDKDALYHFANLKPDDIQSLDLITDSLEEEDWLNISHLSGLRELRLGGVDIVENGLNHLANLPHLRSLHLTACYLAEGTLEALKSAPSLKELKFSFTHMETAGLGVISSLPSISNLLLEGNTVTDDVLAQIDHQNPISDLYIVFANISDQGLECLKHFPKLFQELSRTHCPTKHLKLHYSSA